MTDRTKSLGRRELNRATLARQLLLERHDRSPLSVVEHLVGLQAQVPRDPYIALWSRLVSFDPRVVSDRIADRTLVRAGLMRSTIHLVTAGDCLTIRPLIQGVMARAFGGNFAKRLADVDIDEVLAAGRSLLDERPRTRAEIGRNLAERWPSVDAEALSAAVSFLVPLVQIPPRGLWGESGQATWARMEAWLGRELADDPPMDAVVLPYLAAFGPASVSDVRTWCGVTGLRAVVEGLRPDLEVLRDDAGRELFDLPGAPRPDADEPAPPRFLPEYDNVLLSHDDRSRFLDPAGRSDTPWPNAGPGGTRGSLLVDGLLRAAWTMSGKGASAVLTVHPLVPLRRAARADIEKEGHALLAFLRPGAAPEIRFA